MIPHTKPNLDFITTLLNKKMYNKIQLNPLK